MTNAFEQDESCRVPNPGRDSVAVIIPAYNEERAVAALVEDIRKVHSEYTVIVVSDGSSDRTAACALAAGAVVIDLPCNLGVSGAVQAGLRYAWRKGFSWAVRCDGDGQHPASEIQSLVDELRRGEADLVVGVRNEGKPSFRDSLVRGVGIRYLSLFLSHVCKRTVTDPTSGFHAFNRRLICYFSHYYPTDYPEPESLALIRRQGYRFTEVPVSFQPRRHGRSTLTGWNSLYYALKVTLALIVDRARSVDTRFARHNLDYIDAS